MNINVAVVGFGNRAFSDDGVGSVVAEIAAKCSRGIEAFDVGSNPISFIDNLLRYDILFLIDIASPECMGEDVEFYELESSYEELKNFNTPHIGSSHYLAPLELSEMLVRNFGYRGKIFLVFIKPKSLELWGRLSDEAIYEAKKAIRGINLILKKMKLNMRIDERCFNEELDNYQKANK